MFDTHTFQIPFVGVAASLNRHLKSDRCKKLIICKKISSNRIVAIINISDSVKENKYLNKLIFITLQPSGATVHVIDTLNSLEYDINFNDFEDTIANSGLYAIDPNVVTHDTQIEWNWNNINTIGDLDKLYKKYVSDSAQTAQTAGNRFKKKTYKIRKHNNTRKIKTKYRNRRHKKRY
jgi:hypothetical protein